MDGAAPIPEMQDFDDKDIYKRYETAVLQATSGNFVIQFDSTKAYGALNLQEHSMQKLLQTESTASSSTRWINIWAPDKQRTMIEMLSSRYHFSPRLLGIMCSAHKKPVPPLEKSHPNGLRSRWHAHSWDRKMLDTHASDLEKGEKSVAMLAYSPMPDLSHYKMVNEVWHYCSVDWGVKYLCIGYNSLSDTGHDAKDSPDDADNLMHRETDDFEAWDRSDNNPKGARTWTWLVLCNDGTIISMYEDPFPGHQGKLDWKDQAHLIRIRRNLLNVLKQLSHVTDDDRRKNPINTLYIRPDLQSNLSDQMSKITIADSPGLLFYYLFDDWYTSYALVAKKEHQYAKSLENLRKGMLQKPQVEIVQLLHQYGRQLAVLKRMYESYAMIIERILARQKPVENPAADLHNMSNSHTSQQFRESNTTVRIRRDSSFPEAESVMDHQALGVSLSSAATVRFERLLDRIKHYAISEIQECLDEKEALVFLNFNMITLKQSQAVERLTRITILLAKVTILFMPVSLMTGYFSTQIQDLQDTYTSKTYWICFAVIMTLSFIFLIAFGVLSGTLEGKPIYRSLTETVMEAGRGKWKSKKGKKSR